MHNVLHYIDLIGTFAFALSGAVLAVRKGFDILGVIVLAMVTAIGGGVIRDLCIGDVPPVGLTNGDYFITIMLAVFSVAVAKRFIVSFERTMIFFDALGLGFFAAFGTNKTFLLTGDAQLAIFLGCVSAVGGGITRDVLTGTAPLIFRQEIYATAALIGASIELLGTKNIISPNYSIWIAITVCILIRLISVKYKIKLPSIKSKFS